MLDRKEILGILRETKALREGHFKLASGRHSRQCLQMSQVFQYPKFLEALTAELARRFKADEIDVVVAPAVGGILVAYEVAKALGTRFLFAEREEGRMVFKRGFALEADENVLVVEDVVTTGASVQEVLEAVRERGGHIRGIGIILDRSAGKVHFGHHTEVLLAIEPQTWEPEECPLCKEGVPLCKPR
ncbi:MAG: orotate phosphoribosyltransferase [Patescibacteria group bacterium]